MNYQHVQINKLMPVWQPDIGYLMAKAHIPMRPNLWELTAEAVATACPSAVFGELSTVDAIDVLHLPKRALPQDEQNFVFPFCATGGACLVDLYDKYKNNLLHTIIVDSVAAAALDWITKQTTTYIKKQNNLSGICIISPGACHDYPLARQTKLFAFLNGGPEEIGINLSPEMMMLPVKSLSGVIIPTPQDGEVCLFCEKKDCSQKQPCH